MLRRQRGQAFILVLILLAVGGLLITPALNLASTGLQSRMTQHTNLMEYYATDGAQEYSLWLLGDPDFVADLINSPEGEVGPFYIILNRVNAEYSLSWQAAEDAAPSGAPLTDDRYRITVVVTPDNVPVPDTYKEFTYSITLQYMHPEVVTEPLEQLQVTVPPKFTYMTGSVSGLAGQEPSQTGSFNAGYTYTWDFDPAISFDYWEEKAMGFEAYATPSEYTYYTEVDVRTATPRGATGPTAPIIVGNPPETGVPRLAVTKTVDPIIIPPTIPTLLTYTISLENQSSEVTIPVLTIEDFLPVGFTYLPIDPGVVSGSVFTRFGEAPFDPQKWILFEVDDGIYRHDLEWSFTPTGNLYVNPGETLTLSFQVIGIVDSSGTYANEVFITAPGALVGAEYSWPTGGVIVPQFDIDANSGGTNLRVVTEVTGGSHNIKSWVVE